MMFQLPSPPHGTIYVHVCGLFSLTSLVERKLVLGVGLITNVRSPCKFNNKDISYTIPDSLLSVVRLPDQ